MRINNCNREDQWSKEALAVFKNRQIGMLKRIHPEYNEKTDYVLWIVPDLITEKDEIHIGGTVKVLTWDGKEITYECEVRRPYQQKHISHMSLRMNENEKKVYGVPLIFRNFKELSKVKKVEVKWLYIPDSKNVTIHTLDICYYLTFKRGKTENDRVFTLFLTDKPCRNLKDAEKPTYYQEYDYILSGEMPLEVRRRGINKGEVSITAEKGNNKEKEEMFTYAQATNISFADELGLAGFIKERAKKLLFKKLKFQYESCYMERNEGLKAKNTADLLPEQILGF